MVAKLDAFAYELHTFVSMGQTLAGGSNVRPITQRPAAA